MGVLQNLHTHTVFCDGKDTPEEMVLQAIKIGMDTIGFSAHSFTDFDQSYCLKDTEAYRREILRVKNKYKDSISVLLGIEQDYFSLPSDLQWDFIIGSVHYVKLGEEFVPIDESAEILSDAAKRHFSGDIIPICVEYYKSVADYAKRTDCTIIGHFDLIKKFTEKYPRLINTGDSRFIEAESSALEAVISSGKLIEVNTGAIARGYRSVPYPDESCLRKLSSRSSRIILTSDCHSKEQLDCSFAKTRRLLSECGFKQEWVYQQGGFVPIGII